MAYNENGCNNNNMSGHFGNGQNRRYTNRTDNGNGNRRRTSSRSGSSFFSDISVDRWVDIVCIAVLAIVIICIIVNWNSISDFLFDGALFPIIVTVAKVLGVIIGICLVVGFIYSRICGPRRWWW